MLSKARRPLAELCGIYALTLRSFTLSTPREFITAAIRPG